MVSFCSAGHILFENSLKKVARLLLFLNLYIKRVMSCLDCNLRNFKTHSVDQYTGKPN